jgi:hypothetical protein
MARFAITYCLAIDHANYSLQQPCVLDPGLSSFSSELYKLSESTWQLCYHRWGKNRGRLIWLSLSRS